MCCRQVLLQEAEGAHPSQLGAQRLGSTNTESSEWNLPQQEWWKLPQYQVFIDITQVFPLLNVVLLWQVLMCLPML